MPDRTGTTYPRRCVLMFSGGRDSTLAAIRLLREGYRLVLVTVTSSHLIGMDAVRRRLRELTAILPPDTQWIKVAHPQELHADTSFYERTCLPCHHAYVVLATAIAKSCNCSYVAFGYVGYQRHWPEQTPLAIKTLRSLLSEFGITLLVPLSEVETRAAVEAELSAAGFSVHSLEQKCVRQVNNLMLPDNVLRQQIAQWEQAIRASIDSLHSVNASLLASAKLEDLVE